METSYLVYKQNVFTDALELVAEADTLELCKSYLDSDRFRVVPCYRKSKQNE